MVESHLAFMRSAESATRVMGQLMGAGSIDTSIEMPKFSIPENIDESIQSPAYIDEGDYEETITAVKPAVEETLTVQPQNEEVYKRKEAAEKKEETTIAEHALEEKPFKGEVVEKSKEEGAADLEKLNL